MKIKLNKKQKFIAFIILVIFASCTTDEITKDTVATVGNMKQSDLLWSIFLINVLTNALFE